MGGFERNVTILKFEDQIDIFFKKLFSNVIKWTNIDNRVQKFISIIHGLNFAIFKKNFNNFVI